MTGRQKRLLGRIAAGLLLFAVGLFLPGWWKTGFLLAAWLIAGYDVLWSAVRNILHGQLFDEISDESCHMLRARHAGMDRGRSGHAVFPGGGAV